MTRPVDPGWDLCRSFLAVLRGGSLSAAARDLGLTQPTLGRHIAALEAALATVLFTRAPQGLIPTDAARELAPHAEAMAAAAAALVRTASGGSGTLTGTVRIGASDVIGAEVLPPILTALHETHPAITIELVLSNRTGDLLRRELDIAVRMARPTQAALVGRRIGSVGLGFHAHRRYLDAHGLPASLDDLRRHSLIGFDRETPLTRAIRVEGLPVDRALFALRTDSDLAHLAAIRAGYGIGVCQTGIGRRDPDLVAVLAAEFAIALEMWVVMHEDLRGVRRMRAVFDHLVEGLSHHIATASAGPP